MTTFESSLGKKKIQNKPLREFDVPDESENEQQFNVDAAMKQPGMRQLNMNEIAAFQQKLRNSFPDEEPADQTEVEESFKQAREMKRSGKERLTEGAKRRLESLLGMTRLNRTAVIGETEFVLQTLTGKETRLAILEAAVFDGTVESPFAIRGQLLARSLIGIGGVDFDHFVGSDKIDIKLLFIEELDDIILNRLYDEYLLLNKEAKKKFGINNAQEVQEVVSDIKK